MGEPEVTGRGTDRKASGTLQTPTSPWQVDSRRNKRASPVHGSITRYSPGAAQLDVAKSLNASDSYKHNRSTPATMRLSLRRLACLETMRSPTPPRRPVCAQ